MATPIKDAMNANTYLVQKSILIHCSANVGVALLSPAPAQLVLAIVSGVATMSLTMGETHGSGWDAATYDITFSMDGLSAQLTLA